jgi:predicted permease
MLRKFRRDRGFHLTVVLLPALGIGANTLVFSLVNELLLKSLPVRDPENLYLLESNEPIQVRPNTFFNYPFLTDLLQKSPLLSAAVAEQGWYGPALVPMRRGATVRLVMSQVVSPNYFRELGIQPVLGRLLDETDAATSGALPAVLSDQFWQSEFGGDRGIVGRTIRLKDVPFTVVGVLPREFHSSDVDRAPDIRVPISAQLPLYGRPHQTFEMLVRLKPGVSPAQAADALLPGSRALDERLLREWNPERQKPLTAVELQKEIQSWNYRLALEPIARGVSRMRTQFSRALWILLGGVALLMLAVCANVAGLLFARAGERRKEIGIRLAIGAGRGHIVRQFLAENLILAAAGAALGAGLALIAARPLIALLPPVRDFGQLASPQLLIVRPDLRVFAFAAALTLLSVLLSGLLPAWRAVRVDLSAELKAQPGAQRGLSGAGPLALQVAFCTVLLAAAGLAIRSYRNLDSLDPGFDREHLVSFTFDPGTGGYTPEQSARFFQELLRRVREIPGVRSAAYATLGLMRGVGLKMTVAPEGVTLPKNTFLNTSFMSGTPGLFEAMGIRLLAGRSLTAADVNAQPTPIVVNQAFAKTIFPGQDPLGKRIVQGTDGSKPATHVIVGVVATAKYRSFREVDPPTFYSAFDLSKSNEWQLVLYARTHGAPTSAFTAIRETAASIDSSVPIVEAQTLDREVRDTLWQERLVAILSAFFGIAAVVLAAIGLYGALARGVQQRSRELGIRMAIGARVPHIVSAVARPAAVAIGCGLTLGLAGAAALLRLAAALLFGVEPVDPVSYAAAALVILICSALGAAAPLLRALRIDPARTLRDAG